MTHPTEEELQQFVHGRLRGDRVRGVAQHVNGCRRCAESAMPREQLARAANAVARDVGAVEHPFVETELTAYVDGKLPHADEVRVEAHLEQCAICRDDVDDLRAMKSAATATPHRRNRRPAFALAAVLAAIAVTALLLREPRPEPAPSPAPPLATATIPEPPTTTTPAPDPAPAITETIAPPVKDVPSAWKTAVDRAVRRGAILMPAALTELQLAPDFERGGSTAGPDVIAPYGVVVESTRPVFEWTAVSGATYVVSVVENLEPVMESGTLAVARWRPERHLSRGHVYQWQVTVRAPELNTILPAPPAPPALFRVLDAAAHAELERARADHADDPLLLGVLYAERGLRAEAIRELRKVKTDVGRKLLRSVQGWPSNES
jgi:anti-sigma factor RsiW